MSSNFAIIDLGSNSVRMTVNSVEKNGAWKLLVSKRATVRLSEGMTNDNFLKEEAMSRVTEAVKEFGCIAKEYGCVSIVAVATAALRKAANRELFLSRVKNESGIEFDVISGEQEAYYSYLAVKETVGIKNGIIYDTGGGSTEIILVKDGEIKHSVSLPLGAVVMTEQMSRRSNTQLYKYVSSYIGAIDWIDECQGLPLYGIGGSARAMAMLYKKQWLSPDSLDGIKIPYRAVADIYQKLFITPPEKRKDIKGMDVSRADIILAGITPVKVIMDMTGSGSVCICSSGVKEGVFFRIKEEIMRGNNK